MHAQIATSHLNLRSNACTYGRQDCQCLSLSSPMDWPWVALNRQRAVLLSMAESRKVNIGQRVGHRQEDNIPDEDLLRLW